MQTFKQFLEAREIKDIPHNNIRVILRHINDKNISVKFALYCAEDCFQFNDERTRRPAQRCIDLVKKWLRDPKNVTNQELRSVSNVATPANTPNSAADAIWAAAYAVNATYVTAHTEAAYHAVVNAAWSAAHASGHQDQSPEWNQIYNQKLQEYIRKLKGMTTTRSGYSTSIEPLKGYDNTHFSIMAALDNLEEIDEIGKDHFVYQDNDGQWVFDLGHDNILRADSKEALARLIHNDKYYLNALLRLYNANV